ncbi:sulfotransferase [Simiduia curdlanivorans]|uniref:Sulfotransferase n=1 Tax=Simiduia curdlanivorans TaxID=1492769 RepID=A0ABV8V1M9_9GAMM|nr:sulfotransferase [Simiduia curdlanivorans]MDN3639128.1 sulfotransferase [Simiduia curdlanivorans]
MTVHFNHAVQLFERRDFSGLLSYLGDDYSPVFLPLRVQVCIALNQVEAMRLLLTRLETLRLDVHVWVDISRRLHAAQWAEEACRAALIAARIAPHNATVLSNYGMILRHCGHLSEAADWLSQSLELDPTQGEAQLIYAELAPGKSQKSHIETIKQSLQQSPLPKENAIALHYAVARHYESLGEWGSVMHHLAEGSRLKRASFSYQIERDERMLKALSVQIEPKVSTDFVPEPAQSQPIFIVGLPRTGSSLLEARLAAMSGVRAGGELPYLNDAIMQQYREEIGAPPVSPEAFVQGVYGLNMNAIGRRYMTLSAHLQSDSFFTDKLPINGLNIPLIRAALPDAQIIHLHRDDRAMGFALYRQLFGRVYPYSYDLVELGRYVRAYRQLMSQWQQKISGVHWLNYEVLVADWDAQFSQLCVTIGLAEKQKENANVHFSATASASQIRAPIHQQASEPWRHVTAHLAPYLRQLGS